MERLALNLIYLISLLVSLTGLALIDYRFKLAFFFRAKIAAIVLAISVAFFSAWDLAGISLGIFFRGHSEFLSGLTIAPEFPIEELLFLALLNYSTLILYRVFEVKRGAQ